MGLKKGTTNNPRGRPKGSTNKVNADTREWIKRLINKNRSQLEKDLLKMDAKERWHIIERLLNYSIPRMQSIEAKIDFSQLTDEDLDTVIHEITKDVKS